MTEDGSMTMFDSGGNLLILELACGVDSVIQKFLGSLDAVTLEFMPVWSFLQLNVRPISS